MIRTISFITSHPLTRDRPLAAIARFVRWQIESRFKRDVIFDWVEGAKLVVRNGMTGATGNIYCGLHEFADMGFLLHFLRPGDLFVDVGANIGSYTILASAVCGAGSIAIEPDPNTMKALKENIAINDLGPKVVPIEAAMGRKAGHVRFTVGRDTVNRVANDSDLNVQVVKVECLDDLLQDRAPAFIKLDVEGFEADVIAGASRTLMAPSLLAIETEGRQTEVVESLKRAGFEEYSYEPWSRTLSRSEGQSSNALFLRNRDQVSQRLLSAQKRIILGHLI
ncbi:FkbM family methyltransferase [Hyphomonas sp.]|uniref:FkbM family methyltransferase n=1 Tax=Hyphomonas sp. TaxID=87 RepID=UPI0025BF8C05|nr:FkbM family methyltransferase [Hyphomonas sp.]MBI1399408.1 FkbM family methyltransferase [Hyphomonas sp.]